MKAHFLVAGMVVAAACSLVVARRVGRSPAGLVPIPDRLGCSRKELVATLWAGLVKAMVRYLVALKRSTGRSRLPVAEAIKVAINERAAAA
jgi:hypothetical protein